MKIKLAIICFDNPFLAPMEGGKKAMKSKFLSFLPYTGIYDIDVYLMNKRAEGYTDNYQGFDNKGFNFYQYSMNNSKTVLFPPYPICVNKRYNSGCTEELRKHTYDVAIFEGLQASKYIYKNDIKAKYKILYMHDIESNYRLQVSHGCSSIVLKIANFIESKRFKKMENKIDDLFDELWFISKDECAEIQKRIKNDIKCVYIPIPAGNIKNKIHGCDSNVLTYIGDMSLGHNFLSIKWFEKEVFPLIVKEVPNVELHIIGRISSNDAEKIKQDNVVVMGYVDDIDKAYDESCAIVNPMLYGAGVKVKTIDALSYGQIVVTNSKGIEGTELQADKHIVVEDEPEKMAETCVDILKNRNRYIRIAESGLKFIKKNHSIENQGRLMNEEIINLITR